jgi:putative membrane protein
MSGRTAESATKLDVSTRLSFERTRLSYERTMMAWVRTATSLITFGFTIYKFFQLERPERRYAERGLVGPREFALLLVGIGLCSLLLATWEHRQGMRALRAECPGMPRSTAAAVAALIAILGIVALIVMVLRG